MKFDNNKPIYLQIVENICEKIFSGFWKTDERIPSIREIAVTYGVNPNTVMRCYEYLQTTDIIYNKRGIGFFITENAHSIIENMQRESFFEEDLPYLFKKMHLLNIPIDVITEKHNLFLQQQDKTTNK